MHLGFVHFATLTIFSGKANFLFSIIELSFTILTVTFGSIKPNLSKSISIALSIFIIVS